MKNLPYEKYTYCTKNKVRNIVRLWNIRLSLLVELYENIMTAFQEQVQLQRLNVQRFVDEMQK